MIVVKRFLLKLFYFVNYKKNDILYIGDIMKKISILSLHLGYGGVEKMVVALANRLAE